MVVETLLEPIKQIAETKLKEEDSGDNQILAITIGVFVTVILIIVMATLVVITFRLRLQLRSNNSSPIVNTSLLQEQQVCDIFSKTGHNSHKLPLTHRSPYETYCKTISSDVEVDIFC